MISKTREKLIEKGLFITAIFSIIAILLIIVFIFREGFPIFQGYGVTNFIFGMDWAPSDGKYGIFTMIVGSLYITFLSLAIAVPLSILCAIFMAEVSPEIMRRILKPVIETLAAIPSVVYGFFGLIILVPFIRSSLGGTGFGLLTASLILTVMIMPTIISVSEDALRSVPLEYKEASLALGATQWQTIRKVIFPAALPGIITSIILGMGRAIGETLAVIMVAGNVTQIPSSILDPVRALTSNIALEMGYATGLHYSALFGTAIILFFVIMALLVVANYFHYKKKIVIGGGYL
ncbi:phosphate ABC transporter permease subunit [Methanothermobacter sp. CaT2]|jgi:phosphate transport system permease protein|uniref:Phosphate transport system permease protein n=2 Tax=Methanothermobacter thermautotrophicus TaxID=145262 RepID=O27762_METTH|nr:MULTISPECIES: phosphate ABC transporter permease subunit PstC [Methanothermobacter]MDK2874959.1 phosphate transport system permease protein [Methanothermobacter sp.]AAB86199.1 phosphate transporter permease PstC [Methanothermobacter thermautotrophicus str. Delta H]MDN5374955.1 phosphate transport system permease protein [Methanothermobacter sp.]WBF06205.1 phosphate ABC transporter permease subunit PstC [Methanothermobacter thermautotrophicus]BAM70827.1 phosphate ABC transporter permease sub